jgi:hypothetical protein
MNRLQSDAMEAAFKMPPDYLPRHLMRLMNGGIAVGLSVNR